MCKWIKSDNFQLIRNVDNSTDRFQSINMIEINDLYTVYLSQIDLSDYDKQTIEEDYLKLYCYESINAVKKTYKDCWKQILAECIMETDLLTNDSKILLFEGTETNAYDFINEIYELQLIEILKKENLH